MLNRRSTSGKRRDRGAAVVETAVCLPLFLLFVFGILEYGRFMAVRNLIDHATREGARYAVVHTYDKTEAEIEDYVNDRLAGTQGQLHGLNIDIYKVDPSTGAPAGNWDEAKFGEPIAVRIQGNYTPVASGFLLMPDTIPLEAVSMMNSEAN